MTRRLLKNYFSYFNSFVPFAYGLQEKMRIQWYVGKSEKRKRNLKAWSHRK